LLIFSCSTRGEIQYDRIETRLKNGIVYYNNNKTLLDQDSF
jgi:hypothetical protein